MKHIKAAIFAVLIPTIAFAHSGGRDIKGTITKVDRDVVVVKRADGQSEKVPLTSSTTYRVGNSPGQWQDMHPGSRVVVHLGHDGKAIEVHLPSKK